jgi:hypothetical protein
MNTIQTDPKLMAAELLLLSKEEDFARAKELNLPITGDKFKMVDKIIIAIFGLDACKKAFSRRR